MQERATRVEWLNHHHLLYFWTVAKEGSIARASEVLHLTPQAISAQIKTLEESLGVDLFERAGRGLKLTDTGELVRRYAEDIFTLSRELLDTVKGRPIDRPRLLRVGVADALPKLICHRLLEPALHTPEPVQLICREEGLEILLAELALHRLDMVLSDAPLPPTVRVKAYNHLLGQSGILWMASEGLASELRGDFPRSLNGAPMLVPTADTAVRRSLDLWLQRHDVRPRIVGEIADSALLMAFGEAGEGLVPVSEIVAEQVKRHYSLFEVAPAEGVIESYYAITVERRVRHPAVAAICEQARATLR
jgi:LysR family transcriptional regulator, transcriptional activator of nhaA